MKEVKLTKGFYALVDDVDYDFINDYSWHVDFVKGKTYAAASNITINGVFFKTIRMHRAILNVNRGISIDHDAALVYDQNAKRLFGEFAKLNIV